MGDAGATPAGVKETPLRMKEKQVWDALEGCEGRILLNIHAA